MSIFLFYANGLKSSPKMSSLPEEDVSPKMSPPKMSSEFVGVGVAGAGFGATGLDGAGVGWAATSLSFPNPTETVLP